MSKHTEGPWRWRGRSLKNSDNGWSIVRSTSITSAADKALIAAAPEMLAALAAANALLARHGMGAPQIDAAIAKAEGGDT